MDQYIQEDQENIDLDKETRQPPTEEKNPSNLDTMFAAFMASQIGNQNGSQNGRQEKRQEKNVSMLGIRHRQKINNILLYI